MRDFVAKISLTALFVLAIFSASAAEKVTFEANSPLTVAVGEAFRVEFALNAKPDGDTFKAPSFEGFDVLAGPAISQGSSVQIVNGSMTKSVSYTYTFVLLPQAAGNVTIGAAEVKVDGSSYRTRPLPIEIVNEGEGSRAQQQQGGSNRADDTQADAQSRIGKDDILLRAGVSRSSVYKNEPLHVAFKLYTRVPYVNIVPESAPSFNGFWSQDLSDPNSARVGRETYAGKVYETRVLYDYLRYPAAGRLAHDRPRGHDRRGAGRGAEPPCRSLLRGRPRGVQRSAQGAEPAGHGPSESASGRCSGQLQRRCGQFHDGHPVPFGTDRGQFGRDGHGEDFRHGQPHLRTGPETAAADLLRAV